jgi:myo-inositol-1-phosphate synthase
MQQLQEANGGSNGQPGRRLGIACVGLGGAVATTAAAGMELIRLGLAGHEGLPLAGVESFGDEQLAAYEGLVFGGWDLSDVDLASAARHHGVVDEARIQAAGAALTRIQPWPAAGNKEFCRNISGTNVIPVSGHREAVATIQEDLRRFREEQALDGVVLVNLASTERRVDPSLPVFSSIDAFEEGIAGNDPAIGPAMLYAYAAILDGVPYVNFTPSVGADVPALIQLAAERGVPVAGKDGKTGQTMLKTVLAPAFRARALRVEGWYSTNILGNRDGEVLDDPNSLASKIETKGSVLEGMLGYEVPDHIVRIDYYRPRGDNKEAWDNIDLVGFLGAQMQLKVNFLCGDSVLAAPLVVELARLSDLAKRRGDGGVQEQFGMFFKAPMTETLGEKPEHALLRQEDALLRWLSNGSNGSAGNGSPSPARANAEVNAGASAATGS